MFSPPRTIRSVRRSTTTRRPAASSLPRSPVRTGSSAGTRRLAEVPRAPRRPGGRRSRRRRPAPDRRCARSSRGAAGPPSRARARASADGSAVTPEPISDRPYVGTTGQPASHGPLDERRRDRARPRAAPRGAWRAVARHGRRRGGGRAGTGRARRGWAPGSTGARGAGAGRRRAGGPGSGRRRGSRATATPRPATWPMPSGSAQPVAGGRTSSHASALAAIARCDSTTPFGRRSCPRSGRRWPAPRIRVAAATSRAGNGATTPPSTTIAGSSSARAASRSRVVSPAGRGRNRGAHPEQRDDHGDGLGGRRHRRARHASPARTPRELHRARRWRPRARRAVPTSSAAGRR